MPIQPNLLERLLFYQLNLAPAPLLDLAGALSYQALSTAAQLDLFNALHLKPMTPAELAIHIDAHERGVSTLLKTLEAVGHVQEKNGRYINSSSTEKWLVADGPLDIAAASNAFIQLVALQYYLFADGRIYSRADIGRLLADTGFSNDRFYSLVKAPGTTLVVATKDG